MTQLPHHEVKGLLIEIQCHHKMFEVSRSKRSVNQSDASVNLFTLEDSYGVNSNL